ncbi:MAG: hypothetical protein ACREDP_22255 [Bradyrhizobium sp.]
MRGSSARLAIDAAGHALEVGDHGLDLHEVPTLFFGLEPLEAGERVTGFHTGDTPILRLASGCRIHSNLPHRRADLHHPYATARDHHRKDRLPLPYPTPARCHSVPPFFELATRWKRFVYRLR